MPRATDLEIEGTDGQWRPLHIDLALSSRKKRMRCLECKGPVRLHSASENGMAAHVEHAKRWEGCPRCDHYDGGSLRPHPIQVR